MGSTLEIRMTGGGSAIMHLLDKDTSHEMVTMFHPDGPTLLATHYCAAHNQPRMQLVAAPARIRSLSASRMEPTSALATAT